ncbi:LysR family transcriptional regulator [Acidimangrovimonas pyrenivorans]|uniref:LysR family transcriptional regulator n=1 Tax=Acidimangrovimonas pyrenivorans TaxID=2030798 RepID=A0ABV7ALK8_9RHOB
MDDINPINTLDRTPDGPDGKFVTNLDWNLLRTFVVIAEEGSITRAASRLLRRQPAVSLALQRLETELGMRLIERGGGSFRLTAAGRELYARCVDIYGDIARLKEATTSAAREISGSVTIHLASHVTTPILDRVLTDLYRKHPGISYRMRIRSSAAVAEDVRDQHATLGICLVNRKLPLLDYDVLYREFFGFYCGPPHPLFGRENLRLEDLRNCDSVSFETDDLRDALRPVAQLRQQHLLDLRVVGQSIQLEEVQRMIRCGLGIGPLPVHVVERDVRDGLLWRLPPYSDAPAVDIHLVTNPRRRLSRAERLVVDALRDAIASEPLEARTYGGPETPQASA